MLIGTAKPIPTEPPLRLKMAVFMPTASPLALISGPPLFPGLIEASVWMKSSYGPPPITRPVALTMPVVTVCSRPKGLPMAMTGSPVSKRVRIAQRQHGQIPGGVDLQERDVGLGVLAHDLAGEAPPVGQLDGDLGRAVDHVVVGEDVPVLGG